MSLRQKTLLIVALTTLALVASLYALGQTILLDGFRQVEREAAERQVRQAVAAIEAEISYLSRTAIDWSGWDDTYEFVVDANEEFIESNLVDATLAVASLRINLIAIVDLEGKVVFQKGYDLSADKRVQVPLSFSEHLTETGLLGLPEPLSKRTGIVLLPDAPMLIAARPIVTSEHEGPIRGVVIMGRYLDDHEVERLQSITQLSLSRERLDKGTLEPDYQEARSALGPESRIHVQPLSDTRLAGYTIMKDLYDRDAVLLRVETTREIYQQGLLTVRYLITAVAVAGVFFAAVTVLLLEGTVLRRLADLGQSVRKVGEEKDLEAAVSVSGSDELADLGTTINDMLKQLAQAEREMVRLERLRALGEMAAGVSHNLNNMLLGILIPAEILQDQVKDPGAKKQIDAIMFSATRAAELVRQLHGALPHKREEEGGAVSATAAVKRAVESARPRWKDAAEAEGSTIKMITHLDESVPLVRGTETGLHDVLLNLLFNAIDAMPQGGSLTLCLRADGEDVLLSVEDSGVGMDTSTQRRIFEPFFTTKAAVGTGLGLYTVYNTVNSWGGSVEIESSPGIGSKFTIRLPVAAEDDELPPAKEQAPVRSGRLLVVEDDDTAREFMVKVLSGKHEVSSHDNAAAVLDEFNSGWFDAALIDLGMPGLPGDALAQTLRSRDATLPTILVTGWDIGETDPRLAHFDFCLKKPFRVPELLSTAAEAIQLRDHRGGRT